ncbi:MAG: hypothetical protein ACTSWR_11220 [Candidatus Helarchaeota archaeon]
MRRKKDSIFINYTLTKYQDIKENNLEITNFDHLIGFLRINKLKEYIICKSEGFDNLRKKFSRFLRQILTERSVRIIGLITDRDRGDLNEILKEIIQYYLNTPYKLHNIKPKLEFYSNKIIIRVNKYPKKEIWNIQIPENLEIQIVKVIKKNGFKFGDSMSVHEIIKEYCMENNTNIEKLILENLDEFKVMVWYKKVIKIMKENIIE